MPFKLRKKRNENLYYVVNKLTNKHYSKEALTLDNAKAQMRALYANENKKVSGGYIPTFEEYASERGIPLEGAYSSVSDGTKSTIVSYPTDEIKFDEDKYNQLMKSMKSKEDYERLTKNKSVKQSYEDYVDTFSKVAKERSTTNLGVVARREKDRDLDQVRSDLFRQYITEYPDAEMVLCPIDADGNRVNRDKMETVPKYECKIRHEKNYRVEMDKTGIGKFTNFLTDVGDFVAENSSFLPGVGQVVAEVYKNFAPPTSKFYSDNLIKKFSGSGEFHRRKKTHRENVIEHFDLKDKNYSLEELSKISSVPLSILTEVYRRGIGAYKTNPKSVRLQSSYVKNINAPMSKKLSKERWAMARVYSFLDGNPSHDNDLRENKLSGAGFFDSIFNKAKEYIAIAKQRVVDISRGIRKDNYPPNVRKLLETIGNDPIVEMYVRRDPIKSYLHTALNLITIGMWNRAREKYNYDKIFHLGLELTIKVSSNNDIVGRYVLEKNEVINLQPAKAVSKDTELIRVPMNDSISLNQLLEKTKERMGANMFVYDAFTNNCQDFIANVLLANGFADPKVLSYVKQPLEQVLQSLPSYTKTIAKSATDFAALADVALKGRGKFQNQLQKLKISPQKYLKLARRFAKLYGYDPKNLQISDNPKKKLMYFADGKKIHFGQVGYDDYILYGLSAPQIADEKRRAYLSRATQISGSWKKDPNSANNLAIHILWSPEHDL